MMNACRSRRLPYGVKSARGWVGRAKKQYFYPTVWVIQKAVTMATVGKIFVLDTSVILYDHNALTNFQEHDVAIPIQVLEELDSMKGGNETRNVEARSFIRLI